MHHGFFLFLKNTLSKMVKEMCVKANITGEKTNHSLRASGITAMFQAGLSEKVIPDRSGWMAFGSTNVYQKNNRLRPVMC